LNRLKETRALSEKTRIEFGRIVAELLENEKKDLASTIQGDGVSFY